MLCLFSLYVHLALTHIRYTYWLLCVYIQFVVGLGLVILTSLDILLCQQFIHLRTLIYYYTF